jgi:membrane associated rhomboid family serine protease
MFSIAVIVIAGFAWYVMEADERAKVLRAVLGLVGHAKHAAGAARKRRAEPDAFDAALSERTRWIVATPAIALINLFVFASMAGGPTAPGTPEALLEWGASFGPMTSNGEWARLVTSMFVHSGSLHLLVNLAALVQVGLLLERLIGPAAFAAVYMISGLFASLVSLAGFPVHVSAGSSGAVAGIYGLLLTTIAWTIVQRSAVKIPLRTVKALGPVLAVFVLYNLFESTLQAGAEMAGLLTGAIAGAGLARGAGAARPPLRRVVAATATAFVLAFLCGFPLRGISNVRPELDRLVVLEARITAAYDKAVAQFKLGALSASQLGDVINRTITPELRAARERIRGLRRVPREQQMLVASAEEYLTLRDESFRLRAEALQKANMDALKAADRRERASLDALERTKP